MGLAVLSMMISIFWAFQRSFLILKMAANRKGEGDPVQRELESKIYSDRLAGVDKALDHRALMGNGTDDYKFVLQTADIVCTTLNSCGNLMRYV